MVKIVQIRLIAETEADAETAIAALRDAVGSARVALSSPHKGRKGGYLAYGTLQVQISEMSGVVDTPAPAACPHCGRAHDIRTRLHGDEVWCMACDGWFRVVMRPGGRVELLACAAPAAATGPTQLLGRRRRKT